MEGDLPQLPPEIVEKILCEAKWTAHELESCRCVSKMWNDLCIGILKKYYWPDFLKCQEIKDFVEFVGLNGNREKKDTIPTQYYGMSIGRYSNNNTKLVEDCKFVLEDIQLFLSFTGCDRITCLWLLIRDQLVGADSLLVILEELSPHLLWLDIIVKSDINKSILSSTIQPSSTSVPVAHILDLLRQNQILSFPKLQKLGCGSSTSPVQTPDEIELASSLTIRSPKLVTFDYKGNFTFTEFSIKIPFETIKILKLAMLRKVSSLELLNIVRSCPEKPKLHTFEHDFYVEKTDANFQELKVHMTDVLKEFSQTLKSLTQNFNGLGSFTCIELPILPFLKKLRIRLGGAMIALSMNGLQPLPRNKVYLDVFAMKMSQCTLPVLKFVDIPMAFFWRTHQSAEYNKFQTVKSLNIQVYEYPLKSPKLIDEFLEHVFTIFPNLTQVSLERLGFNKNWNLANTISALLKAPQSKRIQILEFLNYNYDYLGEALIGLDSEAKNMSITLVGVPNSTIEGAERLLVESFMRQYVEFDPANLEITHSSDISTNSHTISAILKHNSDNNLKEIQKLKLGRPKFRGTRTVPFKLDFQIDNTNLDLNQEETRVLHLSTLQKQMPALHTLEISPYILSSTAYLSVYNSVKEIKTHFPQWKVTLF